VAGKYDPVKAQARWIEQNRAGAPPEPTKPTRAVSELLVPRYRHETTITTITPEQVRRLEQAICWGWALMACCDYSGIPVKVYRQLVQDPAVAERFEILRGRPLDIAKRNIAMALEEGDLAISRWLLERRTPEYSPKSQVDVTVHEEVDEASVVNALQRIIAASQAAKPALPDVIDVEVSEIDPLLL